MSRIGKMSIAIPAGVDVIVQENNVVTVKGKLGSLSQEVDPCISVHVEGNELRLTRATDQKRHKAMHGLYRTLLNNMVHGVSEGFTIIQEVVGVGYKAQAQGQLLELSLGYSHNIFFQLSDEIKVEAVMEKGKNPIITLKSFDKQLLGQVAAKLRSLRAPEPYKGKGIRFKGEEVRRKAGKTSVKE